MTPRRLDGSELFDGVARHSQEGKDFVAQKTSASEKLFGSVIGRSVITANEDHLDRR